MSHTVAVSVATTPQSFPAGTVSGGIVVSLGAFPAQTLSAAPYVATFAAIESGDYTITAQAIDSAGAPIGAAVSYPLTIAPDAPATVEIEIPASISVSVV